MVRYVSAAVIEATGIHGWATNSTADFKTSSQYVVVSLA